jgi:hypothetical protein
MISRITSLFRKKEETPAWPFDQPENCAVITTTGVLKNRKDIVYVSHDSDDDGWQFHCVGEARIEDSMMVALKNIVSHDPTVLLIADMPPGWIAVRKDKNSKWERRKKENGG